MKITHAETFVVGTEWRNLTIVRVHTDEGLTGLGEARMVNHTDALVGYLAEAIPRHLVGHDPFHIEDLVKKMGRDWPAGTSSARPSASPSTTSSAARCARR